MDRRAPFGRREAGIRLVLLNLPVRFHRRVALRVALLAGAVQRRRAGVNQVNDAVLRPPGERLPGDPLNGVRRPVGAHVGKHLGGAGELMTHQHGHAVEAVVFGSDDKWLAHPVPVKRAVEQRFSGIAIGVLIGPVALTLETGGDGVVAQRLLHQPFFRQFRVALHHVADAHRHQQALFQHRAALCFIALILLSVLIFAVAEVFIRPRQRHLQLGFIIDFLIDSPAQLRHVDSLDLHAEPGFKEIVVDDGAGDAH